MISLRPLIIQPEVVICKRKQELDQENEQENKKKKERKQELD